MLFKSLEITCRHTGYRSTSQLVGSYTIKLLNQQQVTMHVYSKIITSWLDHTATHLQPMHTLTNSS